jgi:uncharacterized protein
MKIGAKEVIPLDASTLAKCLSDRRLHLILLPTEACNFRCVYCYETFQYKKMAAWVVQGVKRLLERRIPELDVLELSWFGGEPLLAKDVIEDVLRHAGTLAPAHGVTMTSSITTNAYLLTKALFHELLGLGLSRYQISFDGPREYHDRKRVMAGGKGTFDRVWSNLLGMKDATGSFDVLVRLHADRENIAALPEFIDRYREAFGGDARFKLFVRPLSRLGGPSDESLMILGDQEAHESITALRRYAEGRGVPQRPPLPDGPICYAAMGNSFVVRSNGRLNKCTVALEHPANQIGMIRPDGTMEISTPKTLVWMRGLRSGNAKELACPMAGLAEPRGSTALSEDVAVGVGPPESR